MRLTIVFAAVLMLGVSAGLAAQKSAAFSGEIMDSACAKSGSHAAMMKNNPGLTAKECTLACVQHGAKFVLYDAANKKVYQLDNQQKPAEFAGNRVTVTGTLDKATDTIHVSTIEGKT